MLAAFFGYSDIVKTLIEHSANVFAVDHVGMTALEWAIARANFDLVDLLKEAEQLSKKYNAKPLEVAEEIKEEVPVEIIEITEVIEEPVIIIKPEILEPELIEVEIIEDKVVEDSDRYKVSQANIEARANTLDFFKTDSILSVLTKDNLRTLTYVIQIEQSTGLPLDLVDGVERQNINGTLADAIEDWLETNLVFESVINNAPAIEEPVFQEQRLTRKINRNRNKKRSLQRKKGKRHLRRR
jgi:hypothetical protein